MRIRSIKPEFWRSEDINRLSIEDRLLFIGLWSYVDDNGVGRDELPAICADLFAGDMFENSRETVARVTGGLQNLFSAGLIERYEVDGRPYLMVVAWDAHQRIDKPGKERFPRSEHVSGRSLVPVATVSRQSRDSLAPGTGEQGNRGTEEQRNRGTVEVVAERADVTMLCTLLADLIEGNGSKRPTIGKGWLDAARLMIDNDHRTVEDAAALIRWCQQDEFWRGNILSMPKFREKYDQLRLASQKRRGALTAVEHNMDLYLREKARMEAEGEHPMQEIGGVA